MIEELLEVENELFLQTYKRILIDIFHGEGIYLIDKKGDRYMDFFSGLGVNALGYAHPKIIEAVYNQVKKFAHLSNNYITDIQIEFASLLLKYSDMSKIFFTNSGTEAIEGAIKIIRKKYGADKKIFSLTNSFHGRTYGALTLTGNDKYKKGFEPLLPNIFQINFNDINDLITNIDSNTAAIFIEFIQGEGGINIVSQEFVDKLIELRNKFNFVIIADEIQSGIGRTGKPFSFNHFGIKPDLITAAKAIGGGLPLGAILVSDSLANILETGNHGTTFGGNPVSCAAGVAVLREVFENGLMENVKETGNYFLEQLDQIRKEFSEDIKEVRGKGFMIGMELFYEGGEIVNEFFKKKILINCTNQNVLRILPPLITGKKDVDTFIDKFEEILRSR